MALENDGILIVYTTYEALFVGKVRCGYCRGMMKVRHTSARYKTKDGRQQIYQGKLYVCKSKSQCNPKSMNAELVDRAIIIHLTFIDFIIIKRYNKITINAFIIFTKACIHASVKMEDIRNVNIRPDRKTVCLS